MIVVVEHDSGALADVSRQALTFARGVGEPLHTVAFGEGASQAIAAAGAYRAVTGTDVRTAGAYAPAAWAQVLADIASTVGGSAVVASGTDRGNELLAHLGAKIDAPFVANCVSAEADGEGWRVSRQRWGGSLLEDARVTGTPALLSVAPYAVADDPGDASSVEVTSVGLEPSDDDLRARVARVEATEGASVSLGDAKLVVGGGRGVGSAEGFASLDALAAALGGVVGVSRAVTSAGWRPHAEQIGQTGERIAPDLYIACGISGASQHMVGCRGADRLLAINDDEDAPILARSDYAVIGDLHQVVPAIVAELERRRG
jgi:electron transfer flavoprotein alpha subunit